MKRGILIVILVFCLASITNVFASTERAEFDTMEFELAQNVMDKLRILEYSEENLTDKISRVDFAVYLARFLKVNEYEMQDFTYYTDIVKNHYGLKSVNYLTEIGGFNGYGNTEFRPDDLISPVEAIKVIFNILGYKTYAEATGGYPNAYINMAANTELLEGFSGCTDITRGELAVLLLRAGLINTAGFSAGNSSGGILKANSDDNIFSIYWDVYEKEGIVTATDYTSLTSERGKEGSIELEEQFWDYTEFDVTGFLGRYVYALVKEDEDKSELLWMVLDSTKTEQLQICAENIKNYSDFVLEYYNENGKVKYAEIETDAVFVYNGTVLEYDIAEKINSIDKGDVCLIDTDRNGDADTVIINSYKTYIVGYVDRENEIIYDEFSKKQVINLENYEHKKFYSTGGAELDINSISAGTVLNVKESGGVYADIYINNAVISGITTSVFIDEKTGRQAVETDSKNTYLFDSEFIKHSTWFENGQFKGSLGENINFITDMFGDIANITGFGTGNKLIGYIMKVWYAEDEESVKFKLLRSDGSIIVLDGAEKIVVDSKTYKSAKDAYDAICRGDGKVILYKQDASGDINYVDTSYKSEAEFEASLFEATPIERAAWEPADGRYPGCRQWFLRDVSFSGVIMPYSKTVIFTVPEDAEGKGDEYYGVTSYSSFSDGKQIKCNSYKVNEDNFYDDVIVLYSEGTVALNPSSPMLAINDIALVVNGDEITHKISGVSRGKEVSYVVGENCMKIGFTNAANSKSFTSAGEFEPGDLIQIGTDEKGRINAIRLLVDISDGVDSLPSFANNTYYGLKNRGDDYSINRVFCKKNMADGLELSFDEGGDVVWKASLLNGRPTVTVIDTTKTRDMVSIGSVEDIMSYEVGGMDSKPLYIYSLRMFMSDVVVYK